MSSPFDKSAVSRLSEQYDAESRAYVECWAPVLHPISRALLDGLPEHPMERVLDLGAGAGSLLPAIRQKFNGALVIGVDRSEGMLAAANPDGPLAVADAMCLGVRSEAFDLVVMAFMLFHLPDPNVGLVETRRVLRPGGVVGLTTWAADMESPAIRVWNEALDAHGAVPAASLGRIARHDLMDSPDKVRGLLESAGFVSVRARVEEFTHPIGLEEFVRLRRGVGGNKKRLESLDPVTRDRCVAQARERLAKLTEDDFTLRLPIVLASGRSRW